MKTRVRDSLTALETAWVYWPNNPHFLRMKALYGLVFTTQYRADLMLDGIASSIENGTATPPVWFQTLLTSTAEYDRAAERLGNVDGLEPTPWCTDLRRGWHWDFLMDITLDYPLVSAITSSPHSLFSDRF